MYFLGKVWSSVFYQAFGQKLNFQITFLYWVELLEDSFPVKSLSFRTNENWFKKFWTLQKLLSLRSVKLLSICFNSFLLLCPLFTFSDYFLLLLSFSTFSPDSGSFILPLLSYQFFLLLPLTTFSHYLLYVIFLFTFSEYFFTLISLTIFSLHFLFLIFSLIYLLLSLSILQYYFFSLLLLTSSFTTFSNIFSHYFILLLSHSTFSFSDYFLLLFCLITFPQYFI